MTGTFDVIGTEKLIRKATAFHHADAVLKRELTRRLKLALEPTKAAIRASALETLPKSGGLAQLIADSKISVNVVLYGNRAGVRLTTRNPHAIKGLDNGHLRHPVWPRKDQSRDQWKWAPEQVKPNWWSDPVEKSKPEATAAVNAAVHSVLEEIASA